MSFSLPEVRSEQAAHLRDFTGRAATLAEIDAWLADPSGSDYLLVLGGPGSGKSALAAAVAERHGGLLHMMKSHRGPARVLKALVEAAYERAGQTPPADTFEGDVEDLRSALVGGLERVLGARGSALVVIDGLDELEQPEHLALLPAHLPRGARALVTTRPERASMLALAARLRSSRELVLPPLAESEVAAMVVRATGADRAEPGVVARILERTGGLAILVRRAIDGLRAGGRLDDAHVPASVFALYEGAFQELAGAGRGCARLVEVLCLAREPLDAHALAELLAEPLAAVRDHLSRASAYLFEPRPGVFSPWHGGLADYVRSERLAPADVRATEGRLAEFAAAHPDGYGARHRVRHLLAAGLLEPAVRVASDPAYQQGRIANGGVFELVAELDAAGSDDVGVLRRHAHFLARHPEAYRTVTGRGGGSWLSARAPAGGTEDTHRVVYTLAGHGGEVYAVAISPEGRRAASASADGTVRLWDLLTGREERAIEVSEKRALSVAFSPDGRVLYCGTDGEGLRVWRADGNEVARWDDGATIWAVAASAKIDRVATGSRSGEVRLWTPAGDCLATFVPGGVVIALAFSADGSTAYAATTWNRIVGFDVSAAESGGARGELRIEDVGAAPWAVASTESPPGILAACADGVLRQYDLRGALVAERTVTDDRLYAAAFEPSSGRVAFGGALGRLHVSGLEGDAGSASIRAHDAAIDALAFVPGPSGLARVLTASADHSLRCFDIAPEGRPTPEERSSDVTAATFSSDGSHYIAGTFDGAIRLLATTDATWLGRRSIHESRVTALATSPDGSLLATASRDGTARVLRMARLLTAAPVAELRGHEAAALAVVFVPPTGRVATGSTDETVILWSLFGARRVRTWNLGDAVVGLAASPSGSHLAACLRAGAIHVWRTDDDTPGEALSTPTSGDPWRTLRLSDDGELVRDDGCLQISADPGRRETLVRRGASRAAFAYPHAMKTWATHDASSQVAGWVDGELVLLRALPS